MIRPCQPRHLYRRIKPSLPRDLSPPTSYTPVFYNHHLQPEAPTTLRLQTGTHQKRTFLSSILPNPLSSSNNSNGSGGGNNSNARTLTATRTLPYPPSPLFETISSVESYAQFLPFLTASTVTSRDPQTGYPTTAFLTVGYGPLSETFTSKVDCDEEKWVVEAKSGERFSQSAAGSSGSGGGKEASGGFGALAGLAGFPGADEGVFEYLSTKWELVPHGGGNTTVKLEIRFEFKNALYAKMMGAVEGQMAGIMIEAFEKRVREVHGG